MSKVTKLDKAIASIKFILRDRRRLVDEMSSRLELSENQKIYIGRETELIQLVEYLITECKNNYAETMGKLPPQALDIEEAVLGAIILESKAQSVMSFLKKEHFYKENHQEIYKACLALKIESKPIDMRTVVDMLRKLGTIEQVGGAFYIAELTSKVSSAANVEFHARVLIEYAIRRRVIMLNGLTLRDAHDDTRDPLAMLSDFESGLKEIQEWVK